MFSLKTHLNFTKNSHITNNTFFKSFDVNRHVTLFCAIVTIFDIVHIYSHLTGLCSWFLIAFSKIECYSHLVKTIVIFIVCINKMALANGDILLSCMDETTIYISDRNNDGTLPHSETGRKWQTLSN